MIKINNKKYFAIFISIVCIFSILLFILGSSNKNYSSYASYELDNGVYHMEINTYSGIIKQNCLKEPTNIIKFHDGTTLNLPYYKTMPDFLFDSYYNYGANVNSEYGEQEEYWGTLYSDLVDTTTYTNYKITKLIELEVGETVSFNTYARQADAKPTENIHMVLTLDYEAADMSLSCIYWGEVYRTTEDNSSVGFGYPDTDPFNIIYKDEYNNLRESHDSYNPTCTITGKTAGVYCLNVTSQNGNSGYTRDEDYNILVHIKGADEDNLTINNPTINIYQSNNELYHNISVEDNIFLNNDKLNYSMDFANVSEDDNFLYLLCTKYTQKQYKGEKYLFDSFDHLFYVVSYYKDIEKAVFIYPLKLNILDKDSVVIKQNYFCPDEDELGYYIKNNILEEEINSKNLDLNITAYYIDNERVESLNNITEGKHNVQIEYSLSSMQQVFLSDTKDVVFFYSYPVYAYNFDKVPIDEEYKCKVYIDSAYTYSGVVPEISITTDKENEIEFNIGDDFCYIYDVDEGKLEVTIETKYPDGSVFKISKTIELYYEDGNSLTFLFNEGKHISILLDSESNQQLTLPELLQDYIESFDFISFDDKIVKVELKDKIINLIPIKEGTTTIIGISRLDREEYIENSNLKKNLTASIEVTVLKELPEIGISIKKEQNDNSSTSFCINESLIVGVNSSNFIFSGETSYEWYLDNQKVSEESSFKIVIQKAGKHTFKLKLNDSRYVLSYEINREIEVFEEVFKEATLSLNYEGTIYCILGGNNLRINTLINGYENSDYQYIWSYDNSILTEEMRSLTSILFIPKAEGKTELTVITDIGKNQPKILTCKIVIIVETVKDIKISSDKDITTPGSTAVYHLLVNGHKIVNSDLNVNVKNSDKNNVDYINENNDIIINNSLAGKHIVSVNFDDISLEKTFIVSSFNLKRFILAILPYVIILSIIVLFIFVITRLRKAPICTLEDDIKDFDKKVNKEINLLKSGKKVSFNRIRLLRMKLLKIYYYATYLSDDGIEETKLLQGDIHKVLAVLEAIIKTKETEKVVNILVFIKGNECVSLIQTIETIVKARLRAESERSERKMAEAQKLNIKVKKNKSAEQTINDYRDVLNTYRYSDSETDNQEDNK